MALSAAQLQVAIDKFYVNMTRLNSIVNGTNTEDVTTDNGPVPTVAKFFKLAIDNMIPFLNNLVAQMLNAGLLQPAYDARDQAIAAVNTTANDAIITINNAADAAQDLVNDATSGFSGFTDGLGYDFGSITSPTTYFDQDWGTL